MTPPEPPVSPHALASLPWSTMHTTLDLLCFSLELQPEQYLVLGSVPSLLINALFFCCCLLLQLLQQQLSFYARGHSLATYPGLSVDGID